MPIRQSSVVSLSGLLYGIVASESACETADKARKAKPFAKYHLIDQVLIKNIKPCNKPSSFWLSNVFQVIKVHPASLTRQTYLQADSDATILYNEPDLCIYTVTYENEHPKRERRIPAKLNDFDCSN